MCVASGAAVASAQGAARAGVLTSASKPGRNQAIDVLRGLCIVMMITAHVGTSTLINQSAHFLRFVSGAEGFVFLAGLVMGFVYRRKMQTGKVFDAYKAIWRRMLTIWLVHCGVVLMAVAGNGAFYNHAQIPRFSTHAPGEFVYLLVSLKLQPGHALNVLPLYVFLLGFAPMVFELMRRRLTWLVVAASVGLLVYTQYDPGVGSWAHGSSGDAFPPLAWQGLFVPGLCIGYHYGVIRDRIIAPRRTALLWTLSLLLVATVVVVWVHTPAFAFYDRARWDALLWNRHPLRLGRVAYFFVAIAALYMLVQVALARVGMLRPSLEALALLGRNSLYSFLVHIAFSIPITGSALLTGNPIVAEAVTAGVLASVYLMARYQVGRPWVPN